jgi:hypothetical protein
MGGGRGRFLRPLKKFPVREKKIIKKVSGKGRNRACRRWKKKKATREILDIN